MDQELKKSIDTYFRTRTKGQKGVIQDYILVPEKNHDITLCDNDYLNLVNNEKVLDSQIVDLQLSAGRGVVMSPVFLGYDDPQYTLENNMGAWFGKQCHLAQSGYNANSGLVQAICKSGTHVYADLFLHLSFYDSLAAKGALLHLNRHNDTAQLEANIKKHGPGVILVESLYSTTGTYCPLEEIVRIKKQYNCVLVLDESHSFGTCHSKGYAHMKGLQDDVDFITASLAKAYATRAGVVFSPNTRFVKEHSFTYAFSSGLLRNDIVRIEAMWEVIKAADDRRQTLLTASKLLRSELSTVASLTTLEGQLPSAIVALRVKDEDEMVRLHRFLSKNGILGAPFFPPTTPVGSPIMRLSVHSNISKDDISRVRRVVAEFYGKEDTVRGYAKFNTPVAANLELMTSV
ncbi:hypothetical protein QQS21_011687 [Conoideocrella luteorostrata]|uniref:Aminotransferase class I/classII large domain-containing protein n=1 Tax=Conoideocrella luteorostrata TaxID=1105319 RepID=A0AAJ0FN48_9HYPO|nr:hypothetical protein QQS21_011687 [Conoideocrella luteorostrata]